MKDIEMKLKIKKMEVYEEFEKAISTNNDHRANFLRGKLALIDELLREVQYGK